MKKTSDKTPLLFAAGMIAMLVLGGFFSRFALSWVMMSAAIAVCALFYASLEKSRMTSADISAAAVLTALAVVGRIAFAAVPAFKPSQAVIIVAGVYLGARQGFTVGSLTALISNFYFSQGIWTPFQMVSWGLVGLFAGLLAKPLRARRWILLIFGVISGVLYSVLIDFWSVIWVGNRFSFEKYIALMVTSLWFTVGYVIANVVFLVIFMPTAERIFTRLEVRSRRPRSNR